MPHEKVPVTPGIHSTNTDSDHTKHTKKNTTDEKKENKKKMFKKYVLNTSAIKLHLQEKICSGAIGFVDSIIFVSVSSLVSYGS